MNALVPCLMTAFAHFALQAWPRARNPFFGVDCWRHMLAAEYLRRNRSLPKESLDSYLFKGSFDYPPLLIVVLALFPRKARLFLQAVFSPLVDVLHGILVYALVLRWTGNAAAAVFSQIVFALAPVSALENSQLNARSLGSFFLTLVLVGAATWDGGGGTVWIVCAVAAGALTWVTHKMASQTMVLLSLAAVAAYRWVGVTALVGALSLPTGWLLFRGAFRRVLKGQAAVLKYYRRSLSRRGDGTGSVESGSFAGRLVALAKSSALLTAIGANPWIVLLAAMMTVGAWKHTVLAAFSVVPPGIARLAVFWLTTLYLLIFVTTHVAAFRFMGDGPRYSFYLAFPLAVLLGPALAAAAGGRPGTGVAVGAAAALAVAVVLQIVFLQYKGVVCDRERSFRGDVKKIAEILRNHGGARVAVFPLCTAEVLAFFSGCAVLSTDSASAHFENEDFRDFNPRLAKPLRYFLDRYGITHCVAETGRVSDGPDIPEEFDSVYSGRDFSLRERRAKQPA